MVASPEQVRVLVVSASPYVRYVISGELGSEPDLFVVGTAQTPDEVDCKQALLRPDLVIVDLCSQHDLPILQRSIKAAESPVLVLSSHCQEGAGLAFAALEAGATDVVVRSNGSVGEFVFLPDLRCKVRGLARVRPHFRVEMWTGEQMRPKASPRRILPGDHIVFVSVSTGGIGPLLRLLRDVPADLAAALLVLSPLPECYIAPFLDRVDGATTVHVEQAQNGRSMDTGVAYFAPREWLVRIESGGILCLERGEKTDELHSSVDVTLSSLATQYGSAVLAIILSGIGDGGVKGARDVREAGGSVVVQEPATCVAGETPQAVIEAGAATVVLPPERIANGILRQLQAG